MKQDWYKERNKRTDSFAGVNENCHNVRVKIVVTAIAFNYDTQVMVNVLINILARWCSTIHLQCPDVKSLLSDADFSFVEEIKNLVANIDPEGNFTINEHSNNESDITVFIGHPVDKYNMPYITIDGNGWIGSCSFGEFASCEKTTDSRNPLGPAFAACLANAELFRWANQILSEKYRKWYSLYDMTVSDERIVNFHELPQIDLERVHIVGCGAIGSSFTYLLNLTELLGELTFIDADSSVELHNTSSSLLFNTSSVNSGETKPVICSTYIDKNRFKVNKPFTGDYKHFGYDPLRHDKSADLILCFANDFDIWSTIQHLYPPVVFHATTSRSWGINVGRHIPLKDNCLMCTFQHLSKTAYVPKCAEGEMPLPPNQQEPIVNNVEEPHASILPFLSPAAAVVTLAEVAKLFSGIVPNENTTQFNMSTKEGVFLEDQHRAKDCYICKDQSENIYQRLKIRMTF